MVRAALAIVVRDHGPEPSQGLGNRHLVLARVPREVSYPSLFAAAACVVAISSQQANLDRGYNPSTLEVLVKSIRASHFRRTPHGPAALGHCQPLLALLLFQLGCAAQTTERDFARPDLSASSATTVTEAAIIQQYGEPYSRGQLLKHGLMLRSLHYFRLTGDWAAHVRYKKQRWFFFSGDKYLGYSFLTGAPEEQIKFDDSKVPLIIKGKTSRSEVVAMLGLPNASLSYPATPDKTGSDDSTSAPGDTMLDYGYRLSSLDGTWFDQKSLRIVFEASGIAKSVAFEASRKSSEAGAVSGPPGL